MSYTAEKHTESNITTVRLGDSDSATEVAILASLGNRAYEMKVRGANVLYFPFDTPQAAMGVRSLNGIPFLGPWANRMDTGGFSANGKRYAFNEGLGNLRLDANGLPIHGVLWATPLWEIAEVSLDGDSAWVTSRLPLWKYPAMAAQWPFAHEYEMTHRLSGGVLEVRTTVRNLASEPMPVSIGFHPYFQLPGVERDICTARIPVRKHVDTDSRLVPTGVLTPANLPEAIPMNDYRFDDGFTDLVRGDDGLCVFSIEGSGKKIEVTFGPRYQVAVIYAPANQNFICFEPMTALTNGVNLAADGKYSELQWIAAGGTWTESFWVKASGF